MEKIVRAEKSIIVALDRPEIEHASRVVRATYDIEGIGGYKVGSALALNFGLPTAVAAVRAYTDKPVIYDHQKFGSDIPDTGKDVIAAAKSAGVDAIIIFPLSGPASQKAYIESIVRSDLKAIAGGEMTHPNFTYKEGGYIHEQMLAEMYTLSASLGVRDFVVPGNKPARVEFYAGLLGSLIEGRVSLWAPGFVAQGGVITEAADKAGKSFHAIVGRGITEAEDIRGAAIEFTSQLKGQLRVVENPND